MGYTEVITGIQEQLVKRGIPQAEALRAFGPADEEKLAYLTDLYSTFGTQRSVYTPEEMEELKGKQVPAPVLAFFRQYEPKSLPMLECGVRLLGLDSIVEENARLTPGVYLIRFGILVFATTAGGHAVCMDLNQTERGEPRVILVDHTFFSYDEDQRVVKCINGIPAAVRKEYRAAGRSLTASYELIARWTPEISPTFGEFLRSVATGGFEEIADFCPVDEGDLVSWSLKALGWRGTR